LFIGETTTHFLKCPSVYICLLSLLVQVENTYTLKVYSTYGIYNVHQTNLEQIWLHAQINNSMFIMIAPSQLPNSRFVYIWLSYRPSGQNTHMYTKRDLGKPVRVSINNNYCLLVKQQHIFLNALLCTYAYCLYWSK